VGDIHRGTEGRSLARAQGRAAGGRSERHVRAQDTKWGALHAPDRIGYLRCSGHGTRLEVPHHVAVRLAHADELAGDFMHGVSGKASKDASGVENRLLSVDPEER
jgi:hypothetical protein